MSLQAFVIGSAIIGGIYWNNKRIENRIAEKLANGTRKEVKDPYGQIMIVEKDNKGRWCYGYDHEWVPLSNYGDGNWKIVGDKMVNSGYSSAMKKNPPSGRLEHVFAASNTLDGIHKLITKFYAGTETTLHDIGNNEWLVIRTSDGKTLEPYVAKIKNRYKFGY